MFSRERVWKLESWVAGTLGAFIAEAIIRLIFKVTHREKPASAVFDPNDRRFSWPDAAIWGVAGGLGLALAKVVSARLATVGWKAATGSAPPGVDEQAAR